MQYFYDGQIRRYITQTIRVFSNFVVKYGDGSLHQIPVLYGDADRQAASILRNNSENVVNSIPRISVYVTGLDLDRERLSDSTYVGKLHFREREVNNTSNSYTQNQGRNYTVERLMPTPFKLTMKVDIWSANTEQKLQIMEQILVLFNPSLELQTTDNYIDWTSLSVLNLNTISWTSRTVPVGNDTPIEVGSLTLDTPIWISPPVKVKHLGVITKIITNLYNSASEYPTGYLDGVGVDPALQTPGGNVSLGGLFQTETTTITGFKIQVYNNQVTLFDSNDGFSPSETTLEMSLPTGLGEDWQELFDRYPGKFIAGSSRIYLQQPTGSFVIGSVAISPLNPTVLQVNWNTDTLVSNTGIDSNGYLDTDVNYTVPAYRDGTNNQGTPGNFDRIIDPLTFNPSAAVAGTRYLIIEDIGDAINDDPSTAWGALIAKANDIIEFDGTNWNVIFHAAQESDTMVWQTNIYTGIQYKWNGVSWTKSFEGEYLSGQWKIVL